MSVLRRLFNIIFPPDCAECGAHDPHSMLGSYWHTDDCSHNAPPQYPTQYADE